MSQATGSQPTHTLTHWLEVREEVEEKLGVNVLAAVVEDGILWQSNDVLVIHP